MGALLQDLKYGLRIHAKTLGLTSIAVITLALGIGACTTVFAVVDGILLRPLPYPQADQIVIPWRLAPSGMELGFDKMPWGNSDFQILQSDAKSFEDLTAFKGQSFTLTGVDDPVRLQGVRVSAGFFSVLGVSPAIGRTFTPGEDQPGHDQEVILSYDLWREQFEGSPHLLGLQIGLGKQRYTVIGVMPPGFAFPRANEMPGNFDFPRTAQFWVPLALSPGSKLGGESDLAIMGRLKPGISISEAQSEMDVFAGRQDKAQPWIKGWFNSSVTPLNTQVVGDTRRPLWLMMAAVATVLLIACANVASLLLTRSLVRRREFTLRAALGAGHRRLVRQVLTESLLLAFGGGALGLLLSEAGIYVVRIFGPANIPRLPEASLNPVVFGFAFTVTVFTGIFFGMGPALGAVRKNLADSLKEGGQRTGGSPAGPRIRKLLTISQVAMALVLVIAAGLVTKTFFRLLRVDAGFNADHALTFGITLPDSQYKDNDERAVLYGKLLEQLQSVSGAKAVGIGEAVPMVDSPDTTPIEIPGFPVTADNKEPMVSYTIASPGYFSAIGAPLLRGRDFRKSDTGDAARVTVINATMAGKFWPRGDALGKQLTVVETPKRPPLTVVGIVADVKHLSPRDLSAPQMYVLYTQKPWPSMMRMQVAVRTYADPTGITESIRSAVRAVDPDLALAEMTPLTTLAEISMAGDRFVMLVLGAFGIMALLLASIGMYGVLSYSVSQRTQEIGVRMAMGAQRRDIFAMVLGQGGRLAGIGIIIGLLAALLVLQGLRGFLFGVTTTDPFIYGGAVSLLLLSVALLACYVPALRATQVDPIVALRDE